MAIINTDKNSLVVECSCHSHALHITYDDFWKDSIPMIDIAIWERRGAPFPLPWKQRFRWIWSLLKDGTLQGDDVIINENDADAIIKFLSEKVELIKRRETELKNHVQKNQKKV